VTLSELLIRFKIKYIIMAVNLIYCTVAIIARFFTSIITDLNLFWWSVYVQLTKVLVAANIICIIFLIMMMCFKTWNLKYAIVLLVINILIPIIGIYFILFPIIIL